MSIVRTHSAVMSIISTFSYMCRERVDPVDATTAALLRPAP